MCRGVSLGDCEAERCVDEQEAAADALGKCVT